MKRHGYVTVMLLIVLVILALFGMAQCDVAYSTSRASTECKMPIPMLVKKLQ